MIFGNTTMLTSLQVLFRGTYSLRFWAMLQKSEEEVDKIKAACRWLDGGYGDLDTQWMDIYIGVLFWRFGPPSGADG